MRTVAWHAAGRIAAALERAIERPPSEVPNDLGAIATEPVAYAPGQLVCAEGEYSKIPR